MVLFQLAGLPLLAAFVVLLPWPPDRVPRRPWLAMVVLRGALYAVPAWLALAIVRGLVGEPLTGFPLFFSLALGDQLLPVALAVAAFLLAQRRLSFHPAEEGTFLVSLCFFAGFFAALDITDFLRAWGEWDPYELFLLPLMRVATVTLASLAAPRFYRWEGKLGLLYGGLCAAVSLPLTLLAFLSQVGHIGLAAGLVAGLFVGTAVAFALRFPQALQG